MSIIPLQLTELNCPNSDNGALFAETARPKARRKRRVQVAVISDVHLGTYGCHAAELLRYLKSVRPQVLVLTATSSISGNSAKTTGPRPTCGWCAT